MSYSEIPASNTILLIGAGFTKNFGGFLAREMWAQIHNRLQRSNEEPGFFFTLNQDIVFERYFRSVGFSVPGFGKYINANTININNTPFEESWCVNVPTEEKLKKNKMEMNWPNERFYYIKLHGSFHWKDSMGTNKIVIGSSKFADIEKEPIFRRYFEIFKSVLSKQNRRLFIVGYGFRDPHINEVIMDSIKYKGLKLFIICPLDPEDFKNETLKNTGSGNEEIIWEAISGYYPYTIEKIFPSNRHPTPQYTQLMNDFFSKDIKSK